jgi:hypothetical protein
MMGTASSASPRVSIASHYFQVVLTGPEMNRGAEPALTSGVGADPSLEAAPGPSEDGANGEGLSATSHMPLNWR